MADSMEALGMVETRGLVAMIEAADAMVQGREGDLGRLREGRQRTGDGYRSRRCGRRQGGHRCRRSSGSPSG